MRSLLIRQQVTGCSQWGRVCIGLTPLAGWWVGIVGEWRVASESHQRVSAVREKCQNKANWLRSLIIHHQGVKVDRFGIDYPEQSQFRGGEGGTFGAPAGLGTP